MIQKVSYLYTHKDHNFHLKPFDFMLFFRDQLDSRSRHSEFGLGFWVENCSYPCLGQYGFESLD